MNNKKINLTGDFTCTIPDNGIRYIQQKAMESIRRLRDKRYEQQQLELKRNKENLENIRKKWECHCKEYGFISKWCLRGREIELSVENSLVCLCVDLHWFPNSSIGYISDGEKNNNLHELFEDFYDKLLEEEK